MDQDTRLFEDFLRLHMPSNTSYESVVRACQQVFCTLEGLPEDIASLRLDKKTISNAIASWVKFNHGDSLQVWFNQDFDACTDLPTDPRHWISIMQEVLIIPVSDWKTPLPFI